MEKEMKPITRCRAFEWYNLWLEGAAESVVFMKWHATCYKKNLFDFKARNEFYYSPPQACYFSFYRLKNFTD